MSDLYNLTFFLNINLHQISTYIYYYVTIF